MCLDDQCKCFKLFIIWSIPHKESMNFFMETSTIRQTDGWSLNVLYAMCKNITYFYAFSIFYLHYLL